MNLDLTWKITDVAIVLATLIGPILAVQAQKWLERNRAVTERRRWIFRTLMTTRAARLSPTHVDALNAIPIEFYGSTNALISIQEAWKSYLNHMSAEHLSQDVWNAEWTKLFVDLMHQLSQFLGYTFNKVEIEKEIYSPKGHASLESDQAIIRRGLAQLFSGKFSIPMDVKSFPVSPEAFAEQELLRKALLKWLDGEAAVSVEVKQGTNTQ